MPSAVCSLVLPGIIVIADMRQCRACSGLISAICCGLLSTGSQTYSLPIVNLFGTPIGICKFLACDFNARFGLGFGLGNRNCIRRTICCARCMSVCDPVLQRNGIRDHSVIRGFVGHDDLVELTVNGHVGGANGYAREGDGRLIDRVGRSLDNVVEIAIATIFLDSPIPVTIIKIIGIRRPP